MNRIWKLILAILVCQSAGLVGALFTGPAISGWYASLTKPSFSPPNWLFGPVWIFLYTFMGVAVYLVWEKGVRKKEVKSALIIFVIHLIFNSLWSIIFFGLRLPLYAFLEIILLWFLILLTIFKFYRLSKTASFLLLPYLLWVTFASILNFYIVKLN